MSEINIFYKMENETARVYNCTTKKFKTMKMTEVYKLKKRYFMFKGYETNNDGLKFYADDLYKWVEEIKTDSEFCFNYFDYKSHEDITMRFFEKLCRPINKKCLYATWDKHESIDHIEYKWIEACNNSGLVYCKAGLYEDCHGYDFSLQFPSIMTHDRFKVPTCRGVEKTITELPLKSWKCGFYRVKITSSDERFNKIFGYSKQHVYTDISLGFAVECKYKYGYDVNLELIDEPNNCYIYETGVTTGNIIFKFWYDTFMGLKQRYPKNKLIKNMTSALWGRICQHNRLFKTEKQCEDEDIDYVYRYNINHDYYIRNSTFNKKGEEVLELVSTKNPYRYSIARIKPFLLARSRDLTGKIARKHIENVVRIHTDNITFDREFTDCEYEKYPFKLSKENKTTGKIHFIRASCYKHYGNEKYTTKNYSNYENNESDDEMEIDE